MLYERQHIVASVELRMTLHVGSHTAHTLQPTVETRLKLRPRRHSHLHTAYGGKRLVESSHYYLRVQSIEQALVERSPELLRHLWVHVHSNEDVRGAKLLESMFYAIGNVGSHAHLSLHRHVCRSRIAHHTVEQLLSLFHVATHVVVVIHHVQSHKACSVLGIAHHHSHIHQALGILRIFHRN